MIKNELDVITIAPKSEKVKQILIVLKKNTFFVLLLNESDVLLSKKNPIDVGISEIAFAIGLAML